ncbi:hemin uptake protein HemP [uncultured Thiohalocapsa sp.]|uniref:hemin uptake protein HemP n=1 Tax=uncultured Thiohalocapsa sp. TaxID=768990 RepID=UPI0025F21EDD|nr:hemin uptake protein HemP [uncultured Thiohalocapsa sp.]
MHQSAQSLPHGNRTAQIPPRRLTSDELMQGERRIVIEHGDARYTLLVTRNDKLILVK